MQKKLLLRDTIVGCPESLASLYLMLCYTQSIHMCVSVDERKIHLVNIQISESRRVEQKPKETNCHS